MKAADLFTRAPANSGKMFEIPLPSGKGSGEYMRLLHVDSDAFRRTRAELFAEAAQSGKLSDEERRQRHERSSVLLLAALVSDWTLDDPCTPESVCELLSNAPYLQDWISRESENAAAFFGQGSMRLSSTVGQSQPLSSHQQPQTESVAQEESATT